MLRIKGAWMGIMSAFSWLARNLHRATQLIFGRLLDMIDDDYVIG